MLVIPVAAHHWKWCWRPRLSRWHLFEWSISLQNFQLFSSQWSWSCGTGPPWCLLITSTLCYQEHLNKTTVPSTSNKSRKKNVTQKPTSVTWGGAYSVSEFKIWKSLCYIFYCKNASSSTNKPVNVQKENKGQARSVMWDFSQIPTGHLLLNDLNISVFSCS